MSEADILVERRDAALAVVSLHQPAKRNAISWRMWEALKHTFTALAEQPELRVVILRGEGAHFCAGADINEFPQLRHNAEAGLRYACLIDEAITAIMALPRISVAAISGYCMGGGCALAMACDFRVAHPSSRFAIPAAKLGTLYNAQDLQNLLALVGLAQAKRIMYSGQAFTAPEAEAMGFVDALAPEAPEGLQEGVDAFIAPMVDKAPLTIAGSKEALHAALRGELESKAEALNQGLANSLASADYQEGMRAFKEKRKPVFIGK